MLAVNTAGMLVRRSVFEELGGLDDRMPIFGNDIDFGWRAARAGHKTLIVPKAVVFHAEAAHRGARKTALTGRHTHLAERTAAIYTLLANCTAALLPFQLVRLFFGSLLRSVGYLVVRSPGEAVDELAAVLSIFLRPGTIIAARRERSPLAHNDARVRSLLAPRWLPYRHGLDTDQRPGRCSHEPGRRRGRTTPSGEAGRARRASAGADRGRRVLRGLRPRRQVPHQPGRAADDRLRPGRLWVCRDALGGAALSGPGLSPAPAEAADWWRLHAESWHPLAQGSDVAAPAYVLPLALLASLLFGHPGAAVGLLLVLAVPFGTWGAWRFLRVVGRLADPRGASAWLLAWGSITYGLVPIVSGAWAQGRFGTVVAAALLPWLAHAALGFADPVPDRRRRAGWRTGLILAVVTAFTPAAWVYAALVTLAVLGLGLVLARGLLADRTILVPLVTPVLVAPVLLLPWFLPMVLEGRGATLLMEAGRQPGPVADSLDAMSGRLAGVAAPPWAGLMLAALAVGALLLRRSRGLVLVAWCAAGVAAVLVALLSRGGAAPADHRRTARHRFPDRRDPGCRGGRRDARDPAAVDRLR